MSGEIEIILPSPMNSFTGKNKDEVDSIDKVAELKQKGLSFYEISKCTGLTKEKVMKYYHLWINEHKDDLFESKLSIMVEVNGMYPRIIADAEEQYLIAKHKGKAVEMAGWLKVKLEALKEYREYLQSIGFINEATSQFYEQNRENNNDPLLDIINANKQKLADEVKKKDSEANGQSVGNTVQES